MKRSAKRVESSGVPCLDAGSTPATSTLKSAIYVAGFFVYGCVKANNCVVMCAERMRECKRVSPLIHSAHKLTLLAFALIIPLSGFLIGVAVHIGSLV